MTEAATKADPLSLTLFPALKVTTGRPVDWAWPTMLALLADPPAPLRAATKEKLPLVKMGRFVGNSRATGSPLESICGMEGDFDAGTMTPQQAAQALAGAGILCVVATTPSHTPDAPRWRVFAPTSKPLMPSARHQLVKRVNGVLGGALAPESFTLARTFYVGRLDGASDYQCIPVDGEFVDLLPGLDAGAMGPTERQGMAPDAESDADRGFRLAASAIEWKAGRADEARSALYACSPDCDYATWAHLGAAIYAGSGGTGFDLFDEWSSTGTKYPGTDIVAAKFADFGRMSQITYRKLIWIATQLFGWQMAESRKAAKEAKEAAERTVGKMQGKGDDTLPPPTAQMVDLPHCLTNWVYLADGSRVIVKDRGNTMLPFSELSAQYSASAMMIDAGGKGNRVKRVPVADRWLIHPDRITAIRPTNAPGKSEFCADPEGVQCFNLWTRTERHQTPLALAKPFIDHVLYLTDGDGITFTRFMQWLAHIEQKPGQGVQAHYLMVTEAEGIGRNWLASVLGRVWARQVALGVDLTGMIQRGFNAMVAGAVLAVVDEIDEGGNEADKGRFTSALKEILTSTIRHVNPKYGRQYTEWAVTRWLMFSNSRSPIPMSATDRRINVIQNPSEPKGPAYYSDLYALLDDARFIDAVAWYLHTLNIADFNPGERAVWSDAKADVILAGANAVSGSIATLIDEWPGDVVTAEHLRAHVVGQIGIAREKLHNLNKHLTGTHAKLYRRRVTRGTDKFNVIILRNAEHWQAADGPAINAELDRGQRLNEELTQTRKQHLFD